MGAYRHMSELCSDLIGKAEALNYPKSNICILEGNFGKLKSQFPDTYCALMSCSHHRDRRTPMEYGRDLVASWLFEDMLMLVLQNVGIGISGAGADKGREVLSRANVSASSDCVISYKGRSRLLEIMSDYTGYWSRCNKMELRDSKFTMMRKSSSLFLGVSTLDNKYVLLDMAKDFEYYFIPSYSHYGGKPAYSIRLPKSSMKELDMGKLAAEIMEMM